METLRFTLTHDWGTGAELHNGRIVLTCGDTFPANMPAARRYGGY